MKRHHIFAVGIGVLVAMVAVIGLSATLVAQEPGDVGSAECRLVQLDAQDAVAAGMPYNNHGQMVRTAANNQSPALEAGYITEECSSCIMNQFARSIPIAEQEACGALYAECADPGVCGTYVKGICGTGTCGDQATCFEVYEGGGVCAVSTLCADMTNCPTGTAQCAVGEACHTNSCCGENKCKPVADQCWE